MPDEIKSAVMKPGTAAFEDASPQFKQRMHKFDFNIGAARPWLNEEDDKTRITLVNSDGSQGESIVITNANAALTKNEWIELDEEVQQTRLSDLTYVDMALSAGMGTKVKNPMGVTVFQHQTESDGGSAQISMNALKRGERDRQEFDLISTPNPIISSDVEFDMRQIAVSRRMGEGIDVSNARRSTRRVLELREQYALGTLPAFYYGGGHMYGLANFPSRLTGSISDPTSANWIPDDLVTNVNAMLEALRLILVRGKVKILYGSVYNQYLIKDYSAIKGEKTLQARIEEHQRIGPGGMVSSDWLGSKDIVAVAMNKETQEIMNGMGPTPVQWEEQGGLITKIKIICMQNSRMRKDFNSATGVAHYSY